MKRRLCSIALLLALLLTLTPCGVLAAQRSAPIYLGYADVDYMAEEVLKEIPTAGKSTQDQIRAVYDWIMQHCSRYNWDGTYYFDRDTVTAQAGGAFYQTCCEKLDAGKIVLRQEFEADAGYNSGGGVYLSYDSNQYIASFAYEMLMTRTGNCAHYSALLAVLLSHLGYDCRLIPGDFLNNDGSAVEHKWNYVLADGQYVWLDVRMDHAASAGGSLSHAYFMKEDTDAWAKRHSWDHTYSDWLSANASTVSQRYVQAAVDAAGPWSRCSDWARDYMARAGAAGLIPDAMAGQDLTVPITRAEFAAVAVKLYETLKDSVPAYSGENPFSDTDHADVLRAYGLGIVNGVGDGRFEPDGTLTREQAVTMLGRVYELAETSAVSGGAALPQTDLYFLDDGSIGAYARNYVYFFASESIVNGVGDGRFVPKQSMTREQALKVAVETADKLG